MSRRLVVCSLCLSFPLAIAAEEPPPEGEPVVLEEIVVKSQRAPRVDTLEVREVRETSARDLGEALALTPNLDKVRKGGIANDVVLRGMKRDDVALTIDGAKVHGACPSRMDPPAFHLDYAEVDRVEVKKGPFDVTQPGGLGGVVDVRTRRAHAGPGTELNLGGASATALDLSATASYGAERYDVLVGGAFKQANPYLSGDGQNFTLAVPATVPVPATGGTAPNPARFRDTSSDQTAYDVRSGFARVGLAVTPGQRAELSYTRQSAVDVLYPYLKMDGIRDDTDRVAASYTLGAAGPLTRGLAQAYWSRVEHDMTDARRCSSAANPAACTGALPRDYMMRTFARSSVWGGKLEAGLGGPLDAVAGADFYQRGWNNVTTRVMRTMPGLPYADEASIPDVTILDAGLYAHGRRELAQGLRLLGGVRADLARSDAGQDRTDLYAVYYAGQDLALRRTDVLLGGNVQAEYDVLPELTAFAGYGHGARVPDPQERYLALSGMMGNADWLGFPGLRPAQSDELDLGAKWVAPRLLVKAQAFHAWIHDYIGLVNLEVPSASGTRKAKTYANISARTIGGEASARVALRRDLFVGASVAYTRGMNDTAGIPLAEIPPLQTAASLRYDSGVFFVEAEEAWAARQDRVDASVGETPTPSHWVTSLRAGAEWHGAKLFAGVRNLLDVQYYEHLSYLRDPYAAGVKVPEPGRTIYANAQYAF